VLSAEYYACECHAMFYGIVSCTDSRTNTLLLVVPRSESATEIIGESTVKTHINKYIPQYEKENRIRPVRTGLLNI
jgi:hypothetical protein